MATLRRVFAAVDAGFEAQVLWRGAGLDRLVDADHARLAGIAADRLRRYRWDPVLVETTYSIYGERGSIDVLALQPARRAALVVEVKSVVPDMQSMLAGLDRKVRLLPIILRERGWGDGHEPVSRVLFLPGDRTSRRRVERHAATFDRTLPTRTIAVKRWLASPSGEISGIHFLSDVTATAARHRVVAPRGDARACGRGLA